MEDWRLLRNYIDNRSEAAFACLVERHTRLVYWTCRRDLNDPQLAEDAAQVVFLLLAQKGPSLRRGMSIPGWLYKTSRFVARRALGRELRRRSFEIESAAQVEEIPMPMPDWSRIEPGLNDAVDRLAPADRTAILLRFFGGLSLQEVAVEMGTTEEGARKRVSRATDKLRGLLLSADSGLTALTLAGALTENLSKSCPETVTAALAGRAGIGAATASVARLHQGAHTALTPASLKIAAAVLAVSLVGIGLFAIGDRRTGALIAMSPLSLLQPQAAVPQYVPQDSAWRKSAAGCTLTLTGVGQVTGSTLRRWRPDGTPLPDSSLPATSGAAFPTLSPVMLMTETDAANTPSVDFYAIGSLSAAPGRPTVAVGYYCESTVGNATSAGDVIVALMTDGSGAFLLRIAPGPWHAAGRLVPFGTTAAAYGSIVSNSGHTVGTWSARSSSGQSGLPWNSGGRTEVDLNPEGVPVSDDVNVVALDSSGRVTEPQEVSRGDERIGGPAPAATYSFSVPLSSIKSFEVETRPYVLLRYDKVALRPK